MISRLQVQQPFSYKRRTEEQRELLRRVAGLGRIFSWDRRIVFVSLASMPSWGSAVPGRGDCHGPAGSRRSRDWVRLPRAGWGPAVPRLGGIAAGRLGAGGLGTWGDCHGPAGSRRSQDGRLGAGGSGAGGDCCGPAGGRRFRDGRLMAGGGPKTGRFRQLVGLGLCVRWKRRDASSLRRWCQR